MVYFARIHFVRYLPALAVALFSAPSSSACPISTTKDCLVLATRGFDFSGNASAQRLVSRQADSTPARAVLLPSTRML